MKFFKTPSLVAKIQGSTFSSYLVEVRRNPDILFSGQTVSTYLLRLLRCRWLVVGAVVWSGIPISLFLSLTKNQFVGCRVFWQRLDSIVLNFPTHLLSAKKTPSSYTPSLRHVWVSSTASAGDLQKLLKFA